MSDSGSIQTSGRHGERNSNEYEEFLGDGIECPTCRGLGRIKRGNEELVALIPVNDKRLKPRKTILYVGLSILICGTIGILLLFFLLSRSVTLDSNLDTISPMVLSQDNITHYLFVRYQVPVNVTNNNYQAVTVTSLQVTVLLYGETKLNTSTNYTQVTVGLRSTRLHYVTLEATLGANGDTAAVVQTCQMPSPILWKLAVDFDVQAQISYLTSNQTASVTLYNRKICCHINKSPETENPLNIGLQCSEMEPN
ncbi:transmembrane protein 106B-like [Watersipora subatra]|uniref:transmembrane protein 106B-like n=1 Tax=Watersipora subatra TaxID=2589382 RepID=UPI00355B2FB3